MQLSGQVKFLEVELLGQTIYPCQLLIHTPRLPPWKILLWFTLPPRRVENPSSQAYGKGRERAAEPWSRTTPEGVSIPPPRQIKILFLGEQPPCLSQGCYVTNVSPAQIYKFQMKATVFQHKPSFSRSIVRLPRATLYLTLLCSGHSWALWSPRRNKAIFLSLVADTFRFLNWGISPSYESISLFREG